MRTPWEIAIESKELQKIRDVLKSGYVKKDREFKSGYVPEDLRKMITIDFSRPHIPESLFALQRPDERKCSIIEIILGSKDTIFLEMADKLIALGASLPPQKKTRSDFTLVSEYLHYLTLNQEDLFIASRTDPNLMNLQGENQEILLHHAARISIICYMDDYLKMILSQVLLLTANFQKKDRDGSTPLHVAASFSYDQQARNRILPKFIIAAIKSKNGFELDTTDHKGRTFFDIANDNAKCSDIDIDVNAYIRRLWSLCMKPIAEVRKNVRVLLGPKKKDKKGTLSALPIEILMMILERTNIIFFTNLEDSKKRELMREYAKRPKVQHNTGMAAKIHILLDRAFKKFSTHSTLWPITSINMAAVIAHLMHESIAHAHHHLEKKIPSIKQSFPDLTQSRFDKIRLISIVGIACAFMFWLQVIKNFENNESLLGTALYPSPLSTSSLFCISMIITYTIMTAHENNNAFRRVIRDRTYAFCKKIADANPVQHVAPNGTPDAVLLTH